jgi:hypothetical protein
VRIILHAGLHKSGTTSVQKAWRSAFGEAGDVWFPGRSGARAPGHHGLVRPLLSAFTEGHGADTVATHTARSLGRDRRDDLAQVLHEAVGRGVRTLIISSEDLDRVRPSDSAALAWLLADFEVHLLVTATRPVHRWCSGWQTLVKHGLAQYPADAEQHVVDFAALGPGRLKEVVSLLPGVRRTVRLVRSSPPEAALAGDLARLVGLPDVGEQPMGVHNSSLGADTEIVRRINRADLALGTDKVGRALLEDYHRRGFDVRDDATLAERYALPETFGSAAEAEREWLRAATADGVEVVDPHGLLGSWTEPELPGWYAEISRREAVIPELDSPEDLETQLWKVRQQRAAYRRRAEDRQR